MSELRMQVHRFCGGPIQMATLSHSNAMVPFCGWCLKTWDLGKPISENDWRDGELRATRPQPTKKSKVKA